MLAVLALESDDLATSAAHVRIDVEGLPQMVDGGRTRHGTDVQQHADVRLQKGTKRVEEPAVRVDLLLVLLLETEDNLDGYQTLLGALDLVGRRDGD